MPAIDYRAREHESAAAMLASYAAAKLALWGKIEPPSITKDIPVEKPEEQYVEAIIESVAPPEPEPIKLPDCGKRHEVFRIVAEHFDVSVPELLGAGRCKRFVAPRHIAMYILVNGLGFSMPMTGRFMGNKDHTTVLHAYHKLRRRIQNEPIFAGQIASLMRACGL